MLLLPEGQKGRSLGTFHKVILFRKSGSITQKIILTLFPRAFESLKKKSIQLAPPCPSSSVIENPPRILDFREI